MKKEDLYAEHYTLDDLLLPPGFEQIMKKGLKPTESGKYSVQHLARVWGLNLMGHSTRPMIINAEHKKPGGAWIIAGWSYTVELLAHFYGEYISEAGAIKLDNGAGMVYIFHRHNFKRTND